MNLQKINIPYKTKLSNLKKAKSTTINDIIKYDKDNEKYRKCLILMINNIKSENNKW